jgi:hypothetical protein
MKEKNDELLKKIQTLEQHILVNNIVLPAGYEAPSTDAALSPGAQSTEGYFPERTFMNTK